MIRACGAIGQRRAHCRAHRPRAGGRGSERAAKAAGRGPSRQVDELTTCPTPDTGPGAVILCRDFFGQTRRAAAGAGPRAGPGRGLPAGLATGRRSCARAAAAGPPQAGSHRCPAVGKCPGQPRPLNDRRAVKLVARSVARPRSISASLLRVAAAGHRNLAGGPTRRRPAAARPGRVRVWLRRAQTVVWVPGLIVGRKVSTFGPELVGRRTRFA